MKRALATALSTAALLWTPAQAWAQETEEQPVAEADDFSNAIVVTASRRAEDVQDVPIAVSALGEELLESTGTSTIAQITQLQPTVQFISSNARNTSTLIRGLGSNYGLTNDGLELGVGIYVDDVYYARPGSATLDYFDIERVEILRGPQGTLFGKNTTAGAISVITRAPTFEPEGSAEFSVGDYGFRQARATVSGPLIDNLLAGRLTLGAVQRDGFLDNVTTGEDVNGVENQSARAQLLFTPANNIDIRWSADVDEQDPDCCTQVFVRYGPSLRAPARQFPALAAHFGYAPASLNPYDRVTDIDAETQANQTSYGTSLNVNWDFGPATFTSVSAYRGWEWKPQNDRDYTSLDIRRRSQNPSQQNQWSQEFRLTSNGDNAIDWVGGLYAFGQEVETTGAEEYGADAAYWLIGPSVPDNLLDGYTAATHVVSEARSFAAFGEATWHATERLHLTAGLRYTYEEKSIYYNQTVFGGLVTANPMLINAQLGIARPQFYSAEIEDSSPSWRASIAYDLTDDILLYATVANGFKSGGLNAAGIPTQPDGSPSLVSAIIEPEENTTYELGFKSQFFNRALTFNVAAYFTDVSDYQANVVDAGPGAIRGYLANIESVEVKGVELEARFNPHANFTSYTTLAWTDGVYASFPNAPCPLERQSSSTSVCDISGARLPGVSEWVGSIGGEIRHPGELFAVSGEYFFGVDASYRSNWYADASSSIYSEVDPSTLVNLRFGYRTEGGTDAYFSVRNAFDEEYLQLTSVQAGNSGAIFGTPGDPRTITFTIRTRF
jgi:iron complex outermembrane recepter protein